MSTFTEKEIEYLRGQRLGRLATVGRDGSPHVVPVEFRMGPKNEAIEIGGHAVKGSKKWRDLESNPRVAFVIDDLEQVDPWTPRSHRTTALRVVPRPRPLSSRASVSWDQPRLRRAVTSR